MAKRSKTYNRLKPFIVETIANTRARGAVSSGSGGSSGGVTDHGALTGLADDDHTQYLLASGGRTLTGNMAVASGVTIDGVDISAHAANPDAHHDRVTVSDPLAIADQALSLTLGNGVEVSGGALRVKRPTNSGLALDSTGLYLAPSTLTVSTTNAVSGTGHTHAITASSDVGTTPAAALLKSNGSGALTLGALTSKGNVDITTGGDLTVGANILFVDASGSNVGINCAPDPQFDLDVNGNIRGAYIVGKHAIQLDNVLLLAHYDGRAPFETNYLGEPNGHMGQVATVTGGVIYRPGKFGKAVQTGETTTNLCTNPSFETNTTGWTYTDANASGSMARTAYASYVGSYSLQLYNTAGSEDDYAGFSLAGVAGSTAYTITAYAYVTEFVSGAASNRGLYCYDSANAGATAQSTTITALSGGWVRHSVTVVTTASPGSLIVRLYAPRGRVYWDAVQIEQKGYATGYADGDMPNHTWSGTAHASSSSRATLAYLAYPTSGNINAIVGTVAAWVYPYSTGVNGTIFRLTGSTSGYVILRNSGTTLEAFWGTSAVSATAALTANTWKHLAITFDGATLRVYVNGTLATSGAAVGVTGLPTSMYVGIADGVNSPFPGLIDDLVILDRAAPADEIRAVYESDAPVFAETSRYSFRATPKNLVWGDDEGLWIRDYNGGPVLGVYGGEAATKSWGSLTLAQGDLLLGDGASSYLLWDDSAGQLKLTTVSGADTAYLLLSGFYLDMYDASVRRFRLDGDLGKITLGQVASGKANVYITDSLVSLSVYTTDKVVLSATGGDGGNGYIQVGQAGAGQNNVYIDNAGLKMRTGTTSNLSISTAGVITVGEVDTGKSNVLISSGAVKLRNNTTDVITLLASPGTQNTLAKFDGSVEVAANVFAGSYNVRMGTDGHRLVLPSTSSLNISSSSSAIRWFPAIDSTPGATVDYAGQVAYINTSGGGNVLDGLFTAYVGSTNYTTRAARIGLQAGHSDGSTYSDAYLLIVREAGSGDKYGLFVGDHFDIDGALYLKAQASTPTISTSNETRTYVKGGKFIIAYNHSGTVKYRYMDLTLTANPAVWTYTTTAP